MQEGECLVLAGESGSGKTSLLRLVGGLDRADQGLILAVVGAGGAARGLVGTRAQQARDAAAEHAALLADHHFGARLVGLVVDRLPSADRGHLGPGRCGQQQASGQQGRAPKGAKCVFHVVSPGWGGQVIRPMRPRCPSARRCRRARCASA
ncbi:MAG: hypothetical protein B7X56_06645 [Burkholderiales bacterium 34-67-9]|nr:MAG: hypothetical protein B7X56_06645 [Burkholderiales bacterium 34-67-9]